MKTLFFLTLCSILWSCGSKKQTQNEQLFEFDLQRIALKQKTLCHLEKSPHFNEDVLVLQTADRDQSIYISGVGAKVDWTEGKYLICEVYNPNECDATLGFEFYKKINTKEEETSRTSKKEQPVISPQIGILPYIKTKLVLPLSVLDGQSVSVERMPGQLTTFILGNRIDPKEIGEVRISLSTPFRLPHKPSIEIAALYLSNDLPEKFSEPEKPVVDKFGQWNYKEWPKKVKDENQLKNSILTLEKESNGAEFPENWSKYGGWKEKKFRASGFFRTENDGKRWWLVDPEGYAYLCNGIDVITPSMLTQVFRNQNENFFEWLPSGNDTITFKDAISKNRNRESGMNIIRGKSYGYNFYVSNLIRVFGQDWRKHWEGMTINLLKKWRVNTISNWSDIDLAKKSGIPYTIPLRGFPTTKTLLYRDFPDVFSDEYQQNAVAFVKQLQPFKDDPYLVGYFLSNEPKWAFTPEVMAYDSTFNLAYEMFGNASPSSTKKEFIERIKKRYNNSLPDFNKAWNLQLTGFEDLKRHRNRLRPHTNIHC
jgi:hypothetical protein